MKIKLFKPGIPFERLFYRFLLIMRLTTLVMFTILMQVSANTSAQHVTLKKKGITLREFFTEIRKQTNYAVICPSEEMAASKTVDIELSNASLEEAMQQALNGQSLVYTIKYKAIIVKSCDCDIKETPGVINRIVQYIEGLDVHGKIINENGKPMDGVILTIKGEKRSKVTNAAGEFILKGVNEDDWVIISNIGYKTQQISIKSLLKTPVVRMQININELAAAEIEYKRPVGVKIDLNNRKHLNLMEVLEGSIPGLTMRRSSETKSDYTVNGGTETIKENWDNLMATDPGMLVNYTYDTWEKAIIASLGMPQDGNHITVTQRNTTTDNGMIAELRGGGGFTGNTNGMLIVIDGFPQDKFPVNFPMTNVTSMEIIRDPDECIKWGAKGVNGVILIKTNGGNTGVISVDYSSNFYYSPKQNISASSLRLTDTKDVLEYYKEGVARNIIKYLPGAAQIAGLSPARDLIRRLSLGLDSTIFLKEWDSLGNFSNQKQLEMLRQNAFSQNHFLTISGGNLQHQLSITGNYTHSQLGDFGSSNQTIGAVVKGNSSFWENKLKLKLYLNYTRSKSMNKAQNLGNDLEPYQMLLDQNGNYVYDYSRAIDANTNESYIKDGYKSSGINILEDARLNSQTTGNEALDSRLNLDYQIIPGLTWSSGFQYSKHRNWGDQYQDPNSSGVRIKENQFTYYDTGNSINFVLPYGGILTSNGSNTRSLQGRSGLFYLHKFGQDHLVEANFTVSMNSNKTFGAFKNTVYGYLPGQVASSTLDIDRSLTYSTIYKESLSASSLFPDSESSDYDVRNIVANANVSYTLKGIAKVSGNYNSIYSPNFGLDPNYLNTINYSSTLELKLSDYPFFKGMPWISTLIVSGTAGRIVLAELPGQVSGTRTYQPGSDNYSIYIGGFFVPENNGKKINELEGKLFLGLNQERFKLKLKYYIPSIGKTRWSGLVSYDLSNKGFFSIPFINTWIVDISQTNLSPYQGLKSMVEASSGGQGDSYMTNLDYSILPPELINKEAHMYIGFLKDRIGLDLRYYNRLYIGLANGNSVPTDPATGLNTQVTRSSRLSKGFEFAVNLKLLNSEKSLNWRVTLNGAYSKTEVLEVPVVQYTQTAGFLSAPRNAYPSDAVWSYNWAGLDHSGNPNIYNADHVKTDTPDSLSVIYSGRSTSPWSGAIINEWTYKGFFASARMLFMAGGVMRKYTPVPSSLMDRNIDVVNRWEHPGDELFKDVPVMALFDPIRSLITQYSSNSIVSSSCIRLREVQFGYNFPESMLKKSLIKSLSISTQVQNLAVWTFNKDHIDPDRNSFGQSLLPKQPMQFVLSINTSF